MDAQTAVTHVTSCPPLRLASESEKMNIFAIRATRDQGPLLGPRATPTGRAWAASAENGVLPALGGGAVCRYRAVSYAFDTHTISGLTDGRRNVTVTVSLAFARETESDSALKRVGGAYVPWRDSLWRSHLTRGPETRFAAMHKSHNLTRHAATSRDALRSFLSPPVPYSGI